MMHALQKPTDRCQGFFPCTMLFLPMHCCFPLQAVAKAAALEEQLADMRQQLACLTQQLEAATKAQGMVR